MDLNFATVWEALADEMGDRDAFVQGSATLSWRAFDENASRLAEGLSRLGVTEGDRVALVSWNRPELFVVIFAAFKLRAVPVAFNYRFRADEMKEVLNDSASKVVIFDAGLTDVLDETRGDVPTAGQWIQLPGEDAVVGWATRYESHLEHPPKTRSQRSSDDRFIAYTGGTTGRPKGVVWRHQDIANTISFIAYLPLGIPAPETLEEMVAVAAAQVTAGTTPVYLVATPLMHAAGIYGACGTLQVAGRVVLLEDRGFDPAEFLAAIQRERVTSTVIVGDVFAGPIVSELDRAAAEGSPYDLSSLTMLTSSGAAFSAGLKRRFQAHAPTTIIMEAIGSSEGGPYGTAILLPGSEPEATSTFTAGPLTVLIDEDDRIVAWGTPGAFRVGFSGPLPYGYFNDPEKTAEVFREIDGVRYLVPGDYVEIDRDGRLAFLGRGNTCVNTGGEKVYPQEVEEVIKLHPSVADCVVVGVPDEKYGSAVAAVVSLHAERTLDLGTVAAHVKAHLAGYKQPRRLVIVPEVRRSAAGKCDYRWAHGVAVDATGS